MNLILFLYTHFFGFENLKTIYIVLTCISIVWSLIYTNNQNGATFFVFPTFGSDILEKIYLFISFEYITPKSVTYILVFIRIILTFIFGFSIKLFLFATLGINLAMAIWIFAERIDLTHFFSRFSVYLVWYCFVFLTLVLNVIGAILFFM